MKFLGKLPGPESWLRFIVYHPWQIIFSISLVTLFFGIQAPKLRFETSIYDLTIQDLPKTIEYHTFKKDFGCEEIILVVARTRDVFLPETFAQIENLADQLAQVQGVRRVISLPGIRKAMDITEKWDLEGFRQILRPITLFERNILSADGKTSVISLILDDVREKDRVIDATERILKDQQGFVTLYQIGMPIVSKALAEFTERDFLRLPLITFSIILFMLFLFFRNVRGVLIPSGSVLIALTWTFGLMSLTRTPLSLLTMIVPIFLIAVGTAYCMYLFPQYAHAARTADTAKEAALNTFSRIGFPTALAVFTTTIGLGSLLINKISEIRSFALFSCFGILSMLIIMLTLLPAITGLLPLPNKTRGGQGQNRAGLLDRLLDAVIHINLHHQKITLPVIAAIGVVGIMGLLRIEVETNPVDFFKDDTPVATHFSDICQDMAGSFPINVVIESPEGGFFEDPGHLQAIDQLQQFLSSLNGVDKTISFTDYLKLINYATNQYKEEFYTLPEEAFEVRMLVNSFKTMLGRDMLARFMDGNFSKTNILLRTHLSSSKDFLAIQTQIEEHLRQHFPGSFSFQVTGIGIVVSHSSQLITEGQVKSLGLTLLLVFAIMFFLFTSYKVGIIGILPNCFPIVVSFGVMGWSGIPLSLATSLIATIAIGLAVDDTIHYLVGYNREFKRDLDKEGALRKTVRHIGRPILFTTLTISLGFSVLMASSFKPTAVFGLMMVVTMFSALVADLILLPSLMLHAELVTIWDLLKLKLGTNAQKRIPLLKDLSRSQIRHVLMAGTIKAYEADDILFNKGETGDSMYVVISGELRVIDTPGLVVHTHGEGPIQVIATLNVGDVVGEMGMIRSCQRSATVVASQPTELLEINEKMVKRLQWLYPRTATRFFFNLMRVLCDRLEYSTKALMEQTRTDPLTGLHTRYFFTTRLRRKWDLSNSIKDTWPLSFFVITLEDLPRITIQNGYEISDEILKEMGRILKQAVNDPENVCRFDAGQFAGVLPGFTHRDAVMLCENIRLYLEELSFQAPNGSVRVRFHFGVSSTEQQGHEDPPSLIHAAFQALEREREGRKQGIT